MAQYIGVFRNDSNVQQMFHYVEQQRVFITYDERKSILIWLSPSILLVHKGRKIQDFSVNVVKNMQCSSSQGRGKKVSAPDVENRTNNPDTPTAELLETGD